MSGVSIPIHCHEVVFKKHRVNLFLTMMGLYKIKKRNFLDMKHP